MRVIATPDARRADSRFEAGLLCHRREDLLGAETAYREALRHAPGHIQALHHLGIIALQRGQFREALGFIGEARTRGGGDAQLFGNLGHALLGCGRPEGAVEAFEHALRLAPGAQALWIAVGHALFDMKQPGKALEAFRSALRLEPDDPAASNGVAIAMLELDRAAEALPHITHARSLRPREPAYALNRALVWERLAQTEQTLDECRAARELGLTGAQLSFVEGTALLDLGQFEAAVRSFDEAIASDPSLASAYNNRGSAYAALEQHGAAIESFLACLERLPDGQAETLALKCRVNLCASLRVLGRTAQLRPLLERAYQEAPAFDYVASLLLERRLAACDWSDDAQLRAKVQAYSSTGQTLVAPLAMLVASDDPAAQLRCVRRHLESLRLPAPKLPSQPTAIGDRLRVGYLSSDFRLHPVSYLMAGVLEGHDRRQVELFAISTGPNDQSDIRRRIAAGVEHFIDCEGWQPAAIAERIRALGIQVLVDLNGQTLGDHNRVLAPRPAPVQVTYLGFPGTSGAPFIDYLLADDFLVPAGSEVHYSEKLVYLPGSFQANDDRRACPPACPRADTGLRKDAFVFCSFNVSQKLNPTMFDIWCRLLRELPHTVLWLAIKDEEAMRNLRTEAGHRGVSAEQIVFAAHLPYHEHLARLAHADLFLDCVPFNGGTTASDALWMGVPVLTCPGRSFAARMAGSLLHTLGLHELITENLSAYEQRARELAANPAQLFALRARLADPLARSRLFGTEQHCRALESAYRKMWSSHVAGGAPAPIRLSNETAGDSISTGEQPT
jgi:protein O-GlcNAc transferase